MDSQKEASLRSVREAIAMGESRGEDRDLCERIGVSRARTDEQRMKGTHCKGSLALDRCEDDTFLARWIRTVDRKVRTARNA